MPEASVAILDALFAHAPFGLAFWDTDLRYRRVNDALAEINGVPAEDHIGRTPSDVLGALGEEVEHHFRRVLATGEPVLAIDVAGETPGTHGLRRHWLASYYPVRGADGETLGIAGAVHDVTDRREAEEAHDVLLQDALAARVAAERAQVQAESAAREAESERARTEFLARAGARMAASMDYETTLQDVARIAVPGIADLCVIVLAGRNGLELLAAAHRDDAGDAVVRQLAERYPPHPDDAAGIAAVMRTGEAELVPEITDDELREMARDDEHLRLLRTLAPQASLIVPMRAHGRTIGTLVFASSASGRRFGGDDVALARALAARVALHVSIARLYTERSHIARTLQRSLRPRRLPDIPGLELAGRYRAAGDQNDVGGDFYEVFPTGDGAWTALLGDVAGKGAEAAALTSLTRHTLRSAALREARPAANLALLNEALLSEGGDSRLCTVAYVRVEPAAGSARLTVALAGHPRPLVLRADGSVEEVDARGSLLGGFADVEFDERRVDLGPGDLVLLYSDGVTEVRPMDLAFGEQLLRTTVAGHAGATARTVVAAVERSAVEAQDGEPRDDIALLALRVPGRVQAGSPDPG